MKKGTGFLTLFGGAVAVCALLAAPVSMRAQGTETIEDGVYIGNIYVGGMTEEEAVSAVEAYVESADSAEMTLKTGDKSVSVTAADLGISFSNLNVVDEAIDVGRSGNLIKRYKDKKDLQQGDKVIALSLDVDSDAVASILSEKAAQLNQEAVDNGLVRENGAFKIIKGEQGIEVNVEDSIAAIENYISSEWDGGNAEIELVAEVVEPRGSEEDLEQITDMMGSYTTNYKDSGQNRCDNISNATSKINGTLLYPGEEFSVYEAIGPLDAANGYELAGAYENGQTVESYGGGVCQVSTTLYNAVILAELEITQRSNHSMIVSYVKPSMDAAIAGTYKDIKITNNYSTPIYVEGYTQDKQITFTIYGKETRPANRKVEYVSETLGRTSPGDPQLIVDASLAPGARVKVQSSHTGLRSRLWKVVTVDGVEQERTLLNEDTYYASKAIYRVGPALPAVVPPETPAAPAESAPAETSAPAPVTGVDGGPGVSPQPSESASASTETAPAAPAETETSAPAETEPPAPVQTPPEQSAPAAEAPAPAAGDAAPAQVVPVVPEAAG